MKDWGILFALNWSTVKLSSFDIKISRASGSPKKLVGKILSIVLQLSQKTGGVAQGV